MDKAIWLRVINQELGLLEQLAIGMIDDENLSREEVELAISRAKIVVREFEMLLDQTAVHPACPVPENQPVVVEKIPVESFQPAEPPVAENTGPAAGNRQPVVAESPVRPVSPSSYPTSLDHELITPSVEIYSLEREEQNLLNLDAKREEAPHFKAIPLKSLKEGLLLNDRYLFQRELFNDDKSRLDETIAALDRLSNIHEAVEYLKANFRWTKSEASEKFVQLVKRRFS